MHTRVEAFKICCITTSPVRIDLTKGSPKKLDIKMPKKILSHCTSQVERKKIESYTSINTHRNCCNVFVQNSADESTPLGYQDDDLYTRAHFISSRSLPLPW